MERLARQGNPSVVEAFSQCTGGLDSNVGASHSAFKRKENIFNSVTYLQTSPFPHRLFANHDIARKDLLHEQKAVFRTPDRVKRMLGRAAHLTDAFQSPGGTGDPMNCYLFLTGDRHNSERSLQAPVSAHAVKHMYTSSTQQARKLRSHSGRAGAMALGSFSRAPLIACK